LQIESSAFYMLWGSISRQQGASWDCRWRHPPEVRGSCKCIK